MDALKVLEEKFPSRKWELRNEGSFEKKVVCDNKDTGLTFCQFSEMVIPTFTDEQKENMEKENLRGVIQQIKVQWRIKNERDTD